MHGSMDAMMMMIVHSLVCHLSLYLLGQGGVELPGDLGAGDHDEPEVRS